MEFFNSQEDVLDVQLTSYGKHLLSNGKFVPKYYSFVDNDIIYDNQYVSGSSIELQNSVEDRINSTPRLKTQFSFSSPVDKLSKITSFFVGKRKNYIPLVDNLEFFTLSPLGNSELGNQKYPALDILFLNGEISGSANVYEQGNFYQQKIPQINTKILFKTAVTPVGTENLNVKYNPCLKFGDGDSSAFGGFSDLYEINENMDLQIIEDFVLLNLKENNVESKIENFEIEVYEVLEEKVNGISQEILKPLFFKQDNFIIKNDVLVEQINNIDNSDYTSEDVNAYVDILTDDEIPNFILCYFKDKIQEEQNFSFEIDDCKIKNNSFDNPYDNIERGEEIISC